MREPVCFVYSLYFSPFITDGSLNPPDSVGTELRAVELANKNYANSVTAPGRGVNG